MVVVVDSTRIRIRSPKPHPRVAQFGSLIELQNRIRSVGGIFSTRITIRNPKPIPRL